MLKQRKAVDVKNSIVMPCKVWRYRGCAPKERLRETRSTQAFAESRVAQLASTASSERVARIVILERADFGAKGRNLATWWLC
jgi:hypothetical protein